MSLTLYDRTYYTNPHVDFIINQDIVEYDMKSAGFSISKEYKLLDDRELAYLETLDKVRRRVRIGVLQNTIPDFKKRLLESFKLARKRFMEGNGLTDKDILAIKNDAIFTTKICKNTVFGEIEFVQKNYFTSFMKFEYYEFYYNSGKLHVSGISDQAMEKHDNYMGNIIKVFFDCMETNDMDKIRNLLKDFSYYYKTRQLDKGYYRELNADGMYLTNLTVNGKFIKLEHIDNLTDIDIRYNYNMYILAMISMV